MSRQSWDTQGFDMEVLKGAQRNIETICGVQTEMSVTPIYDGMPSYLESLDYLAKRNFSPTGFFPVSDDGILTAG